MITLIENVDVYTNIQSKTKAELLFDIAKDFYIQNNLTADYSLRKANEFYISLVQSGVIIEMEDLPTLDKFLPDEFNNPFEECDDINSSDFLSTMDRMEVLLKEVKELQEEEKALDLNELEENE